MKQYMDKSALVAEIERRKFELQSRIAELGSFESNTLGLFQEVDLYDDILSFLNTLEVKEVDLEKAKAYDEAKARMSIAYNSNRCTIGFMNEIFPELAESEDERIRKVLLNDFKNNCSEYYCEGVNRDMIIAWLEKQGEQENLQEMFETAKRQGYKEGLRAGRAEVWKQIEKKIEQKSAWSEEDTSLFVRIQGILSVCKSHSLLSPDLYEEMCDWLKSLSDRIQRSRNNE